MSKTSRLSPGTIEGDLAAQDAITEMGDYVPANPEYRVAALDALKQDMLAKKAVESAALRAAASARDDADDAERVYHEAIIGAKTAVKAQYGKDSNEVQAVGLKKSSEIVRGRRRPAANKG